MELLKVTWQGYWGLSPEEDLTHSRLLYVTISATLFPFKLFEAFSGHAPEISVVEPPEPKAEKQNVRLSISSGSDASLI